ncbi:MAG: hypothetical protein GXY68_05090 [Chloroflexi bacterium]|nr:hypothetical protein [Chloroflexota bacterium]
MTAIVGTGLEGYIKRNAREQALSRIAGADAEARRLVERGEHRATALRQQAAVDSALASQIVRQRTLAQAALEAQALRLQRREAVLQQVWQRATERLAALAAEERRAGLVALVTDAAAQLAGLQTEGGELTLQVNAADAVLLDAAALDALAAQLAPLGIARLALAPQPADIAGGVIVSAPTAAGRARRLVDNSWDERLRLAYDALRDDIYHLLAAPLEAEPGAPQPGVSPHDQGAR